MKHNHVARHSITWQYTSNNYNPPFLKHKLHAIKVMSSLCTPWRHMGRGSIAPPSLNFGTRQQWSALQFGRFTPGEIYTVPTEDVLVGQAVGPNILENNSGFSSCPKSNQYYLAVQLLV